jgi:uncharacterized RDD family membrane protein YckC
LGKRNKKRKEKEREKERTLNFIIGAPIIMLLLLTVWIVGGLMFPWNGYIGEAAMRVIAGSLVVGVPPMLIICLVCFAYIIGDNVRRFCNIRKKIVYQLL